MLSGRFFGCVVFMVSGLMFGLVDVWCRFAPLG